MTECGGDIYRCEKCGDEKPGFAWRLMLQVGSLRKILIKMFSKLIVEI